MSKQNGGYFTKWYKENKDERNARRRERYADDPEYRAQVVERSREQRERKRKVPKVRLPRFQKPKREELPDGSVIHLYSVGAFAKLIGRSIQSISHWENKGLIPETPYRDSRGFRYFTRSMMAVVIREIDGRRRLFPANPEMYSRIESAWRELGVPVGEADSWDEAIEKTRAMKEPSDDDVFESDESDEEPVKTA